MVALKWKQSRRFSHCLVAENIKSCQKIWNDCHSAGPLNLSANEQITMMTASVTELVELTTTQQTVTNKKSTKQTLSNLSCFTDTDRKIRKPINFAHHFTHHVVSFMYLLWFVYVSNIKTNHGICCLYLNDVIWPKCFQVFSSIFWALNQILICKIIYCDSW